MNSILAAKLCLMSLIVVSSVAQPAPVDSSVPGIFVATSPCDAASRLLLKIPETVPCELIKWHLTLYYHDQGKLDPQSYKLSYTYGLLKQGTNEIFQGGVRGERKGTWSVARGTRTDPGAVVYRLDPDKSLETVSLQMLNENLLHWLDRDERLMVGNAGWSYTLNRTGNPARPTGNTASSPSTTTAPLTATGSSVPEAFVGRSPCHDIAREMNRVVSADCTKVKWELILYRDPGTHTPTTYKLKGTFYRERVGEGRWTITKGTRSNPDLVIYRLDPDKPQRSLFFLKAGDDILLFLDKDRNFLIGNEDFSYTLNRTTDVSKN